MISAGAGPWIYPEFRNRGSPILAGTAPKKTAPPLKLSQGEGENLSLARLIRRVNVLI